MNQLVHIPQIKDDFIVYFQMTFDSKNYLFSHKSLPSRIKYEIDRQRECIRATLGADFAKVMEYVNVKLPARFNPQIKESLSA